MNLRKHSCQEEVLARFQDTPSDTSSDENNFLLKAKLMGILFLLQVLQRANLMVVLKKWAVQFFIFLFYLPCLSSIHGKANCIAIFWT